MRRERSWPTALERFEQKYIPEPNTGCWLWLAARQSTNPKKDYGYFAIDGRRRAIPAHRAAWILFRGSIPDALWVLHKCDTPGCVNPDHLFLGTPQDNAIDRERKGRRLFQPYRGEGHPRSKLRDEQIIAIRADTRSQRLVASHFGVSQATISAIKLRQGWAHVS